MIKKLTAIALILGAVAFAVFWLLTSPQQLSGKKFDELQSAVSSKADLANGELVFWAGGCGSCHADKGAKGEAKKRLGGGHRLDTPAGVFVTPNISPDADTGIGNWTINEFANAMFNGVSPQGSHYYPSFPYTSYTRMNAKDVVDLFAYLRTLPAVKKSNQSHELNPLFALRRGVGLWKLVFLNDAPIAEVPSNDKMLARGQYLVESLGHCGECHTPRTAFGFGGMDGSRWLAGGPAPEGDGKIPNITPDQKGLAGWSVGDIADYLKTGFTPEFDSVGGSMVSVQANMAKLSDDDLAAIAAYLKAIPPVSN